MNPRKLGFLLVINLVAAAAAAQLAKKMDFPAITNFLRLNQQICTGGQPSMDDLAKLKDEGIRAVINLRLPSEYNAEEEAAKAKALGLRYIHIPVSTADPKEDQADEFLKVTADLQNRPAFIHCASANRVGAFWMIRRVLVDNWKLEDAETEARKIGMRSPNLVEFARTYIQRHKQKPLSQKEKQQRMDAAQEDLSTIWINEVAYVGQHGKFATVEELIASGSLGQRWLADMATSTAWSSTRTHSRSARTPFSRSSLRSTRRSSALVYSRCLPR